MATKEKTKAPPPKATKQDEFAQTVKALGKELKKEGKIKVSLEEVGGPEMATLVLQAAAMHARKPKVDIKIHKVSATATVVTDEG